MAKNVQASLEPEESCVILMISDDSCTCESWVSLENNCSVNLRAMDFQFGSCMIDGAIKHEDCPEILPPGSWGNLYLPIDDQAVPGNYEEILHLNVTGKDITLKVFYEVVNVQTGCGCNTHENDLAPHIGLILLAALLALRQRSFRRSAHEGTPPG